MGGRLKGSTRVHRVLLVSILFVVLVSAFVRLLLTSRSSTAYFLCIDAQQIQEWVNVEKLSSPFISKFNGLECALVSSFSNSNQTFRCCHENQVTLSLFDNGSGSWKIPLSSSICMHSLDREDTVWLFTAVNGGYLGEIIVDLQQCARNENKPIFAVIQDDGFSEYVAFIAAEGEIVVSSAASSFQMGGQKWHSVAIPESMGGGAFYVKVWTSAQQLAASDRILENTPSFYLCFSEQDRAEMICLTANATEASALFDGKYSVCIQRCAIPKRMNKQITRYPKACQ